VYSVFNSLKFGELEKRSLVPLLKDPAGVSLSTLRQITRDRFEDYELLNRTINKDRHSDKATKNFEEGAPPTTGAAGQTDKTDEEDNTQTDDEDEEAKNAKKTKWPPKPPPKWLPKPQEKPLKRGPCGLCLSNDEDDISHWITQCPKIGPSTLRELYDKNFCIFCLQEDTDLHRKLKCKLKDAAGHPLKIFCDECDCNKLFCQFPKKHIFIVIPHEAREQGHKRVPHNVQFDSEEDEQPSAE
jgi:hypothetical protein